MKNRKRSADTRRTVIIAGAANVLVGSVKLAAGIMSGSSAMLAESAHSAADTLDQVFLLMSLRRGDRPASRAHPFGHGQERYFWSLLAAFGIFVAGGGFSVFEAEIESRPGVAALLELRTMHIGPDSLIVAARVALADELAADQTEDLADEIDRRLSEQLPVQPHVFIDPTQHAGVSSLETGEARRPAAP